MTTKKFTGNFASYGYTEWMEYLKAQAEHIRMSDGLLPVDKILKSSDPNYWSSNVALMVCDIAMAIVESIQLEHGFTKGNTIKGYPTRCGNIANKLELKILSRYNEICGDKAYPIIAGPTAFRIEQTIKNTGELPEISSCNNETGEIFIFNIPDLSRELAIGIFNCLLITIEEYSLYPEDVKYWFIPTVFSSYGFPWGGTNLYWISGAIYGKNNNSYSILDRDFFS